MAKVKTPHCPLILRSPRLVEAFAKADDERDFFLEKNEGFLVYVDLDAPQEQLDALATEIASSPDRYLPVPKLTNYEVKKIMESFTNEKVYDIDTKEKLLDIIGGSDAREQFLEFLHENHVELDKWLTFHQERSRIRIIEWLRSHDLQFVFEEDLDLSAPIIEKLKGTLLQPKVARDLSQARKILQTKAASYYLPEALNPRPKRGRPPKHVQKIEVEQQLSGDIYTTVPAAVRPFLYVPEMAAITLATFSSRYETEDAFLASLRDSEKARTAESDELSQKLATLRSLSRQVLGRASAKRAETSPPLPPEPPLQLEPEAAPKKEATPEKKAAPPRRGPAKKAAPKKASVKKAAPETKPAKAPEKPSKVRRLLKRVSKRKKAD
jgi:Uncharacterised protein family (UPF0158)